MDFPSLRAPSPGGQGVLFGQGMGRCKARFFTFLIRFAPRWKK